MSNHEIEVPKEIVAILEKIEAKKKPTADEQLAVRTFLGTLNTSIRNPACKSKELNNPNPIEVDVSLQRPETLDQRVRRIMSVSARIAASQGFETPQEADDFDVADNFDSMPNSPFEMVDHFQPMQPEQPVPNSGDPNATAATPSSGSGEAEASAGGSEAEAEGTVT